MSATSRGTSLVGCLRFPFLGEEGGRTGPRTAGGRTAGGHGDTYIRDAMRGADVGGGRGGAPPFPSSPLPSVCLPWVDWPCSVLPFCGRGPPARTTIIIIHSSVPCLPGHGEEARGGPVVACLPAPHAPPWVSGLITCPSVCCCCCLLGGRGERRKRDGRQGRTGRTLARDTDACGPVGGRGPGPPCAARNPLPSGGAPRVVCLLCAGRCGPLSAAHFLAFAGPAGRHGRQQTDGPTTVIIGLLVTTIVDAAHTPRPALPQA